MLHTANQELATILDGYEGVEELPEEVFTMCKELMRTVKEALRMVDKPDPSLSEKEQLEHTKTCLLTIDDHIAAMLHTYKNPGAGAVQGM